MYIDVDFSENLTIPVKYEPQSLHWAHEQVTVHSGILKVNGVKSYYSYFSDTKVHDQVFVNTVLQEMLSEVENMEKHDTILIESDNCSSEYKSSQHFCNIQELSNKLNKTIIRVYGAAGHGKGEVDHVGGLAKVSICHRVAAGEVFTNSSEIIEYLEKKFKDSTKPCYYFKEIDCSVLDQACSEASLQRFPTISGSSSFQIVIFKPNCEVFKAANRICMCSQCQVDYGTCKEFSSYQIICKQLTKTHLRSNNNEAVDDCQESDVSDFIRLESFVAIAADNTSINSV